MHPKSPKLLDDVLRSCQRIGAYIRDLTWEEYADNQLVRDAVARNLTIIGEALSRLDRVDAATSRRISGFHQIIALRHRLADGYEDDIDDAKIWDTVVHVIPDLLREVDALMEVADDDGSFPDQVLQH